jgi:hypothetical protein
MREGFQHAADGGRIDAAQDGAGNRCGRPQHDLGVDERGGGLDPAHGLRLAHHLRGLDERPGVPHEDRLGLATENAGFEVGFKAAHHRDDHDQGHDPDGDPRDGQVGDERDEGLLLLGPQIPPADEELK